MRPMAFVVTIALLEVFAFAAASAYLVACLSTHCSQTNLLVVRLPVEDTATALTLAECMLYLIVNHTGPAVVQSDRTDLVVLGL